MTAPERTWTDVGKPYHDYGNRERVETAIEALDWQPAEGELPAMQGFALRGAIEQLKIPKVSRIAIHGGELMYPDGPDDTAYYAIYGVEGNYKNGRAQVFVLDRGTELTVLCSDFYPKEGDG